MSVLQKLSKIELLVVCKELGIVKCSSKNKTQLIELIDASRKKQDFVVHESKTIPKTIPMPIPKTKPTFIEVCAGGGGLSSGLIKAGFEPLLLNDNNKDCCSTLRKNHINANVVLESMDKIDYAPYANRVDLLAGGLACQSYSQSGLRKGLDDPRGALMFKFIDIRDLVMPKVFMIENVKGMLSHDGGETMKKIMSALGESGKYVISYKCLDASKYDVPQKRERVFIIGVLKSVVGEFKFPEECVNVRVLRDVLLDVPSSCGAKYPEKKITLFKMIPEGGCWINLPENLQKEYLGNSYHSGGGKRGILHRLAMSKPSLTLLCTPSQKQTERCHPLEERPLTIRECARIQTFADDYEFVGSMSSQYKQIGNAVPVELAKKIGVAVMALLNE